MKGYIEERAMEIARYIIDNNATVRQAAKKYGISKSTVHKDVTERLRQISPALAVKTRVVLDVNKSERPYSWGNGDERKISSSTSYLIQIECIKVIEKMCFGAFSLLGIQSIISYYL